ncbi:MAG: S-methyl-5-thioribose-1-phosphate isomerase [Chloroflexota bacterium]|nr:S-methyl-5-thioribose-1-phosphate isomerase [Chloroflexota bacterium]
MAAQHQRVRTVWWEEGAVCMLDQSLLPRQVVFLRLTHEQQVADAIVTLKVRGAPAIGVTAALGMLLAAQRFLREEGADSEGMQASAALQSHLTAVGQLLARTRPTAVNLFWALERMQRCSDHMTPPQNMLARLRDEALAIAAEDVAACRQMGAYGAELIADGDTLLTHCNAGALATSGMGTALAPIYTAQQAGKHIHVFVDETRPVLQGARLTAWELQQQGVPLTLITDNMAGHFMQQGAIKAVFVGADRIAANGDVANKIGTYSVAVLAQAHSIPFYVVAPCSTIDLTLPSGELIPIEQRNPDEVTSVGGVALAPAGVQVANPAFDVTPHALVSAIITEKGILRAPYTSALRRLFASENITGKV